MSRDEIAERMNAEYDRVAALLGPSDNGYAKWSLDDRHRRPTGICVYAKWAGGLKLFYSPAGVPLAASMPEEAMPQCMERDADYWTPAVGPNAGQRFHYFKYSLCFGRLARYQPQSEETKAKTRATRERKKVEKEREAIPLFAHLF